MRIAAVGGGPAGLYSALLLKKADPGREVCVIERNPRGATYGWGVVFSDRTLTSFREADHKTYERIVDDFVIWDAIDVRFKGEVVRCGGQVFSGIARKKLLEILVERCEELGVALEFDRDLRGSDELEGYDLIVAADGVRSVLRSEDGNPFGTTVHEGSSRFIWFGTDYPFDSFTFAFEPHEAGLFQAHAYPFDGSMSTFIVECAEPVWRAAGLDTASEADSISFCERLFQEHLRGHKLVSNESRWINFPTIKNRTWRAGSKVLVGDAAHTAHFSIGSGTKLAMEDAIALANAFEDHDEIGKALGAYQVERKPRVERFQEAARQSQTYFEHTGRYAHLEPVQLAFHLLTRSGRIDYDALRVSDPRFVATVDRWFASSIRRSAPVVATPPSLTPLEVGPRTLENRIVLRSAPTYSADEGDPGTGDGAALAAASRQGPGLVLTAPVAVSASGRITSGCAGLYSEAQLDSWAALVASVRSSGVAVGVCLSHAGRRGATEPRHRSSDRPLDPGWDLLAPSAVAYSRVARVPREASRQELSEVQGHFVEAAKKALEAGFDLIEIHMARGYLLGSFLSPLSNRRDDGYGGSLEARLRYPQEVLTAVREVWPTDRLLSVILSATDWQRGGTSIKDAVTTARILRNSGCDLIEVVAGQATARYSPRFDPYYLSHYSEVIRHEADVPTIATGAITTAGHVNTLVAGGRADLCEIQPT